jgi:hypothetical protein
MHEQKFSFNNKLISKLFTVTSAISKLKSFIIIQLNRRKKHKNVFSVLSYRLHTTDGFYYNTILFSRDL